MKKRKPGKHVVADHMHALEKHRLAAELAAACPLLARGHQAAREHGNTILFVLFLFIFKK